MKLTDFQRDTSRYGPKLWFDVDGDEDAFRNAMNRCDWEETHHDEIVDGRWEVDRTVSAIQEIERETGQSIPRTELIDDDPVAAFKIPSGSLMIQIEQLSRDLRNILNEELSYTATYWDQDQNTERTYQESVIEDDEIPIGLRHRVEEILGELNVDYAMVDYRDQPDPFQIDYEWNFEYDLRDYQNAGLSRMMQGSCIIQWPTGTGKTVGALRAMKYWGLRSLVLVHRQDLLDQWVRKVESILGVTPGVVQQDREEYRDVTVAMIPTLHNRIEENPGMKIDDFDVVITDECHHLQADTWLDVALKTDAYYRYGLSATIGEQMEREDGHTLKIASGIGPIAVAISPEDMIEQGFLAEPQFEWLLPQRYDGNPDGWQAAYREGIVEHTDRNRIIPQRAQELIEDGRRVLVDVDWTDHGESLIRRFENGLQMERWDPSMYDRTQKPLEDLPDPSQIGARPIPIVHDRHRCLGYSSGGDMLTAVRTAVEVTDDPVFWVYGETDTEVRNYLLDQFRDGSVTGMVSTLLREGIDVPELDAVILAGGGKSPIKGIQTVGRSLRPEGSEDALIVDCKDVGPYVGDHTRHRYQIFDEYYGRFCENEPPGY